MILYRRLNRFWTWFTVFKFESKLQLHKRWHSLTKRYAHIWVPHLFLLSFIHNHPLSQLYFLLTFQCYLEKNLCYMKESLLYLLPWIWQLEYFMYSSGQCMHWGPKTIYFLQDYTSQGYVLVALINLLVSLPRNNIFNKILLLQQDLDQIAIVIFSIASHWSTKIIHVIKIKIKIV